jgi:hypothetical protein
VHKAVHNWVEKFSQGHFKVTDAQPGAEVAETTVKILYALVKRWDKCMSVGEGYVKK